MDALIIFGAKYLWTIGIFVAVIFFILESLQKKARLALFGVFVLPLAYMAAKIAGHFFYNPRPFVVGQFSPLIPHAADNGFPSDHVLLLAAVASLFFIYNRIIGIMLWILAVLVGISRVFAGIHHTVDIIGSATIAALISFIVFIFIHMLLKKFGDKKI